LDTERLLAQEILPTRSGVSALRYLAEAARELTGARYAAIGVAKGEGHGFSELVTAGFSPEEQAGFAESLPGARGEADGVLRYLLKGLRRVELLTALRALADGEMLLSREDLARSLHQLNENISDSVSLAQDLIHPLSERQIEVFRLLATGLGNREIGALLFVSENTIKTHVVHIIGKLGVPDRVQGAVWAARNGLLELA